MSPPKLPTLPELPKPGTPFRIIRKLLKGSRAGVKEIINEVKELEQDIRENK